MKFTILTKTFADMIKTVSRANGARTNGEGGISLRVPDEGNTLTARAGNDMISISHTEKIISGESGEVRIPNTYLQDITMRLAGEMVTFSHKDTEGKAKISAGPSDFQLVTSNNRLFFPENKSEWEFSVNSATLASAIKKVTFAAGKNDNKPIFNGCHLEVADGKLTLAATNTHRLAIKQCTAKYEQENFNAAKAKEGVTIPAQALNEAAHIIKDDTGDTRIAIGKSHVAFYSQETTLIANLLSGKYPDFRRLTYSPRLKPGDSRIITALAC